MKIISEWSSFLGPIADQPEYTEEYRIVKTGDNDEAVYAISCRAKVKEGQEENPWIVVNDPELLCRRIETLESLVQYLLRWL